MRGAIEGLESAHPIGLTLPALFQEDEFAQRFVSGLDQALAPIFTTLDSIDAYFDATIAPPDFLAWLAQWVGVAVDENWPPQRQRDLVAEMVELYGRRGTVEGLRHLVRISTGVEPEIVDSGGVAWSPVPGGQAPGSPDPRLHVRLPPGGGNARRVADFVKAATPAHVIVEVEEAGE